MNPVPETLAAEIQESLNQLLFQSEKFRDWESPEIQTIIDSLQKLKKIDARMAYCQLGTLSAICARVDDLFDYYSKAAHLPDLQSTNSDFYLSFCNAGLYGKAHELGSWLLSPKRGFFPKFWNRVASFGQILEVSKLLPDAKRTYPDLAAGDFAVVVDAASVMSLRGFDDDKIFVLLDLMGEVQRKHGTMFAGDVGFSIRVMRPPEDEPYLYLTIPVNESMDYVHAMNRDLTRLIVERLPDGIYPPGLVMSFAKARLETLREAA